MAQSVPGTVQPGAVERTLQSKVQELRDDRIEVPAPQGFGAPSGAENVHFSLRSVELIGVQSIDPDRLSAAYAGLIGHDVTLAQIFDSARQITASYAKAGYALSFALVPAQKVDKATGVVRIDVIEGYVAEVRFEGDTGSVPPALRAFGHNITQSRPLKTAALERFLLLMNDLPGYTANAVFERMDKAPKGATRLVVKLAHQPVIASVEVDNRGSNAFGPWQVGANVTLNSLLGEGESIALRGLRALNSNQLTAGVAKIALPLNGDGLSFSATTTYSNAHPGSVSLAALHFASSGWTASGQINAALVRNRSQSLWLWAGLSGKWLRSDLAATPNSRDKIYALETGVTWTERDDTGLTAVDLTMARGLDVFGATTVSSLLRSRQAGSGVFTTGSFDASRLQRLTDTSAGAFDLFATVSGQIASRGLLSPSQCGYGGAAFGRGFDNNEIVGDQCVMGSLELRFTPQLGGALAGVADGVQVFATADAGKVRNLGTLGYGDKRSESAESIGGGLRFRLLDHVAMSMEYDKPLGHTVALEGSSNGRIFLQLTLAN